jgi:hypothetical protein
VDDKQLNYGSASTSALAAQTVTITITPTKTALTTLEHLHTLHAPIKIVFHPHNGPPTTASHTVTIHYHPAARRKAQV